jgi:hypothetical protein
MILHFPSLHPGLAARPPFAGLSFLDPGAGAPAGGAMFRPDALPLDERTAQAYLREFIQFGGQFKDLRELSAYGAAGIEDFYAGTSMSIRSDLTALDRGTVPGTGGEKDRDALVRAQLTLILAWSMEERVAEMQGLNDKVRCAWSGFGRTLGLDEGQEDEEDAAGLAGLKDVLMSQAPTVSLDEFTLPWRTVLEAILAFLPDGAVLLSYDPSIREEMEEFGLAFAPAGQADLARLGLAEGVFADGELAWTEAPGHRLLARRGRPEGPAWLERSRRVLLPAR